jgi:hypothetical protein
MKKAMSAQSSLEIRFKVKSNVWGGFQDLGTMPTNFSKFVAQLSKKYYPNNFTISYVSSDFQTAFIGDNKTYECLLAYLRLNAIKEAKFYVTIIKKENKNSKNRRSQRINELREESADTSLSSNNRNSNVSKIEILITNVCRSGDFNNQYALVDDIQRNYINNKCRDNYDMDIDDIKKTKKKIDVNVF